MRWYYACTQRYQSYSSGNIQIQKKIADVRAWDDIMHKVHNGTVFIKGIYTSGNSRMAELVRPNIQKKIADICIHEMILCM